MAGKAIKLSIVSTLYNSKDTFADFVSSYSAMADKLTKGAYEIILVNDGSPDNSIELAPDLVKAYPKLKILDLSRNFGQHKALLTGLEVAKGKQIYICDSDMEEPAEWLERFWKMMNGKGEEFDVVGGIQERRSRNFLDNAFGGISWKIFSALSSTKLLPNLVTARLMSRRYVDAILSYPERHVFLATLCSDVGFSQTYLGVEKIHHSVTTYSFSRKLRMFFDGITAFSTAPLYISIICSLVLGLASLILLAITLFQYFATETLPGWASQMALSSFVFSALFFVLSVQGLYIGRIFMETKGRPRTIVKTTISADDKDG